MRNLSETIYRLYYIIYVVLTEPYFYFFRRNLARKIQMDWIESSSSWREFKDRSIENIIEIGLRVPFYKSNFKDLKTSEKITLNDFPIISKKDIRSRIHDFCKPGIFVPRSVFNTGGSTGEPFKFYNTCYARQVEFAHQLFFYKRVDYKKGDKIASIDGVKLSEKKLEGNIFWKKSSINFPFGSTRFSATNLTYENATAYVDKLISLKPSLIRGYPSAISLISDFIIKNNLGHEFYFVKGIMLTSENISEYQIELVNDAFNCSVLPQYGMTETCAFGFTEPNDLIYYCSPYYGVTEVVNMKNEHVEPGEIGEIVLTSFGNVYQPFIRYKTGDLAQYGGVENGFVILDKIIGRTQDYIIDFDNRKIMLVGLIFGVHSVVFGKINIWQIIQNVKGEVLIKLDCIEGWKVEDELELIKLISANNSIKINIIYTKEFELTKAGKRKFMIQNVGK